MPKIFAFSSVVYKGCGRCSDKVKTSPFGVHDVKIYEEDEDEPEYLIRDRPMRKKKPKKLNIDNCVECETNEDGEACNAGMVPVMSSVLVWLLVSGNI